jgi:rSAM/selenodomain-associated transferase 2
MLNVIIPARNEARVIGAALNTLQPARRNGVRLLLVDGQSTDATVQVSRGLVDTVLIAAPGRAAQLNAGAAATESGNFWFLHADTRVSAEAWQAVQQALDDGAVWGRFDVRLDGASGWFRMIEKMMNIRSRLSGIATGDQGIFVARETFLEVGGFPSQPLMEDVEISRRLKRKGRPACRRETILTSSRRWEEQGVLRTILLMWALRGAYAFGADPAWLARRYRTVR